MSQRIVHVMTYCITQHSAHRSYSSLPQSDTHRDTFPSNKQIIIAVTFTNVPQESWIQPSAHAFYSLKHYPVDQLSVREFTMRKNNDTASRSTAQSYAVTMISNSLTAIHTHQNLLHTLFVLYFSSIRITLSQITKSLTPWKATASSTSTLTQETCHIAM